MSDAWGNDPIQTGQPAPQEGGAGDWGNDPVAGTSKFKFSDQSITDAQKKPNSTVIYMPPSQYLALAPDLPDNPRSDKKGASLQKSLSKGDDVDEIPSLDVAVGKDGTAKVTDQDGRHRALFAKQAGVDLIPVAISRSGDKAAIKNLSGMRDDSQPVPFNFRPVAAPKAAPGPQTAQDGQKPLPRWDVLGDIGRAAAPAWEGLKKDVKDAYAAPTNLAGEGQRVMAAAKAPLDALGVVASPITGGLIHGVGGNIIASAIDRDPGITAGLPGNKDPKAIADRLTDFATAANPLSGEAAASRLPAEIGEARGAPQPANALAAQTPKPSISAQPVNALNVATEARPAASEAAAADPSVGKNYADKVERLKAEGVDPTIGQTKGGQARRQEEAHKSNPYIGGAIRAQEQKAVDSFNTALYNRALAPIGKKASADIPIGRDGIKAVGNKISDEFESLKPKMRLKPDDGFIDSLADIRTQVTELPPAQQSQFEAILNNRVLHRLGQTGEMDGSTFKTVESELGTLSRQYKSSSDAAQRGLGNAIDDVTGAMRGALERSSDPGIRKQLTNANKSYAILTRLEDAAAARKAGGGVITPGDLLGAVRKADKSVRKRSFSRGDAMLQDIAEDAWDVLGNKVPDSGTAERLFQAPRGSIGAGIGGAIGGFPGAAAGWAIDRSLPMVTNPIAGKAMNALKSAGTARAAMANAPSGGLDLINRAPLPGVQNQLAQGIFRAAHVAGLRATQANALRSMMNGQPQSPVGQPQQPGQ